MTSANAGPIYAFKVSSNRLIGFSSHQPSKLTTDLAVTGITAGELLVGVDFRPNNGLLYGLGINDGTNTGTLYCISTRTGFAAAVGTPSSIVFVDAGLATIDLPNPGTASYGFDFNPKVDRIRVTTATGLNFRINPNTGLPIDGDLGGAATPGINPDGNINGSGSTGVSATAYTNNAMNAAFTTLYTLDDASNSLYIQNLPNAGTQTLSQTVFFMAAPLDFGAVNGFDIAPGINVAADNAAVTSGSAFAALGVGGINGLYRIDLTNAVATRIGNIDTGATPLQGMAVQNDSRGVPMIGLVSGPDGLVRFNSSAPGASITVPLSGIAAGETMVALDFRPQTGQLMGIAVNATANNGTLYLVDPQIGTATAVGSTGAISFVDATMTPVDLPPAATGYGMDFNPTVDRIRVTIGDGRNFRVNPNNGVPVDGDFGGSSGSLPGVNPDGNISGSGATGIVGAAYTNSYGQSLTGGVTTLYTLDANSDNLLIQNPANAGTQTLAVPLALNGSPLDFTASGGFDIPADVRVTVSAARASGIGYAALTVGGVSSIFQIDLGTGVTKLLGAAPATLGGLTLADALDKLMSDGFE